MKLLIAAALSSLILAGCAANSNYHYQPQNNPQKWDGKNIADLKKQWGEADQVMHTRSGTSFYVYSANSTANFFNSTTTNFGMSGQAFTRPNVQSNMSLQCTTVFKTNEQGVIVNVAHQGSNCGGQWVAGSKHKSS